MMLLAVVIFYAKPSFDVKVPPLKDTVESFLGLCDPAINSTIVVTEKCLLTWSRMSHKKVAIRNDVAKTE